MVSFSRILVAAAGGAMLCAGANPHLAMGSYKPASNVVEHSQIVFDIGDLTTATGAGEYATAKTIYQDGKYSCKTPTSVRKLQAFVNADTVESKLNGTAFFDSFAGGAGPPSSRGPIPGTGRLNLSPTFWDDFVMGALDGTGDFAGLSDSMRKTAVKKGVLGVLTMYTARELESAISKATDGSTEDGNGAPHAWDEGWAFYYGSHPTEGKYSAWEFTKKRDLDYAWDGDNVRVEGAVEGKAMILNYFREGLKASRTETLSVSDMITARDNIYRVLALSSIRAALKYAYKTQSSEYNDEYHMEAYAYFLAAAGWVEQAAPGVGAAVLDLLDFKKSSSELDSDLYCEVKRTLIPAYEPLGLDCEKVGVLKSLPDSVNCTDLPPCPTVADLPSGLDSYEPDTTTAAGSNMDCGAAFTSESTTATTAESSSAMPLAASSLVAWLAVALLVQRP